MLVEADYVGAELAAMAWLSGDAAMIDHVRRSALPESDPDYYDIHSNVTVGAFGLACEPTKAGLKAGGKAHLRTVAKSIIFGLAFGRGAKAISRAALEEGIDVTVEEAQMVKDTIFKTYPGLEPYFAACRARVKFPRWLQNSFGAYRRFPRAANLRELGGYEREAMNFPVQSLVADAMSRALDELVKYRKWFSPSELDYRLVLQIHDAVLLEVPTPHLRRVVDEVLPTCLTHNVPIYPTRLNGALTGHGPYHLATEIEVYTQWGVPLSLADQCQLVAACRDECVGVPR